MQRDRVVVARTWLRTAERDLRLAHVAIEVEPSLAAFHAQQAAEKALKALLVATTDDHERTHTAGRLARELRLADVTISEEVERDASALDLFYLTSRYPDTIGDEDPGNVISQDDATRAVERATRVLDFARRRISPAAPTD